MRMAHKTGNPSRVSNSSSDWLNFTGFLGDVCIVFFNGPPGNKSVVEESGHVSVTMSACQDQLNVGFPKVCYVVGTSTLHVYAPKYDAEQSKLLLDL